MAIKTPITVEAQAVHHFENEYYEKLQNMFTEKIRVNPETCVYKQWPSTQYASENQPFSNGMVDYSY